MTCTPVRCTPVRYTPMRHTPIRYTLVGCMPVMFVLVFENSFVVLNAEPGLAGMSVSTAVYDPLSRMDAYEDSNTFSMSRVDSRYASKLELWR
jgi:hypothetical protein